MRVSAKYRFLNIMLQLIDRPAMVFGLLALVFGAWFIFKLPPLSGTDEFTHFPRAYQISMGTFWEQRLPGHQFGGWLPLNVNNMVNDYRNLSRFPTGAAYLNGAKQLDAKYAQITNPGKKTAEANFTSTVLYPPWAYFPSLVGLVSAKALKLPLIWYVYLSRISNYLIWLILTVLAIRFIPAGKWFMVALALLPTSLSQAATIGGDGIQMSLAWLVIALTLALAAKKLKPHWPVLLVTLLAAVYVAIIKDGYFLLGLVPLAVPISVFAKKHWGWIWKGALCLAVVVCAGLFTLHTVHTARGTVLTPTIGMYFNSSAQFHYVFTHPLTYIWHVIEQPFNKVFDTTFLGIVGIMTNRLIYISVLVIGLLFVGLYLGMHESPGVERLMRYRSRLVVNFSAIFVLTYGLLASAFYVGNTSVGAYYVNGFYGRYFLPFLPLLLIFPLTFKTRQDPGSPLARIGISAISLIGLIAMALSIQ